MSIDTALCDLLAVETYSFPKSADPQEEKAAFGDLLEDKGATWRLKCSHRLNPPASECAIQHAEHELGFVLPGELHTLLRATNGADLFVSPSIGFDTPLAAHKVLNTDELIARNKYALDCFRYSFATDPDYKEVRRLNYVVFCDVNNGNYAAIVLEGSAKDRVFFLDREGCFRPYSPRDADMYYTLADSLEGWLALLRDTEGCAGTGWARW